VQHKFDADNTFCIIPVTLNVTRIQQHISTSLSHTLCAQQQIANTSTNAALTFEIELLSPDTPLWGGDDGAPSSAAAAGRIRRRGTTIVGSDALQRAAAANMAAVSKCIAASERHDTHTHSYECIFVVE
jgi:hypothetical protein